MIYLDNAATTYPKPQGVCDAVVSCMLNAGGNPGRGAHPPAMAAARVVYECRERLAKLFDASDPGRVILTAGATHALNIAVKGLPRSGCGAVGERIHLIISDIEHNSVRRPIERLCRDGLADYSVFHSGAEKGGSDAVEVCAEIERLICRRTRAVICTAASNICSVSLPVARIGELCRRRGLIFIVDGAQGAGHLPLKVREYGIDALALPGHKGLYGPGGIGALILGERYLPEPLMEGGSGAASFDAEMPSEPPERYEAGTLNIPGAAGLSAGMDFIMRRGIDSVRRHEELLFEYAVDRLRRIRGVRLCAAGAPGAVLSFNLGSLPSDKVAGLLGERGICVRGGFHCAPMAHHTLGTEEYGSVRIGLGMFNTKSDIDALCDAMRDLS